MEEKLRRLHAEGLSFSVIATRISTALQRFTRNACIGKAARMGLPERKSGGSNPIKKSKPRRADGMLTKRLRKMHKKVVGAPGLVFEMIEVAPEPPAPEHWLTFEQIKPDGCRYPMGEGDAKRFCPLERCGENSSYCAHHHGLTHTPLTPWQRGGFVLNLKLAAGKA